MFRVSHDKHLCRRIRQVIQSVAHRAGRHVGQTAVFLGQGVRLPYQEFFLDVRLDMIAFFPAIRQSFQGSPEGNGRMGIDFPRQAALHKGAIVRDQGYVEAQIGRVGLGRHIHAPRRNQKNDSFFGGAADGRLVSFRNGDGTAQQRTIHITGN